MLNPRPAPVPQQLYSPTPLAYAAPAPNTPQATQARPQAYLTAASTPATPNYYGDTAASHHVTNQGQQIQQLSPFEGPDLIFIGNGRGVSVSSVGNSVFKSPINPNKDLVLKNLLHVPSITKNLISVSRFGRDNNAFFEFWPDYCLVKSQDTEKVLLEGVIGPDRLYEFAGLQLKSASKPSLIEHCITHTVNMVSAHNSSFSTWHNRLGHPSLAIRKLY